MLASGVALTLATAPTADAQMQWTDQAFVSVNLRRAGAFAITDHAEPPRISTTSRPASTPPRTSAAAPSSTSPAATRCGATLPSASASRTSGSKTDSTVNASIPDPLFFDQPRSLTTTAPDAQPLADRDQPDRHLGHADHRQDRHRLSVRPDHLHGQPGPAGRADDQRAGPTITSLPLESEDKTTMGMHFGVDVTYMVTPALRRRRHRPLLVGLGRPRRCARSP